AVAWRRPGLPEHARGELQPQAEQEDVPGGRVLDPLAAGSRRPSCRRRRDQRRGAQDQAARPEAQGHGPRLGPDHHRGLRREPLPRGPQPARRAHRGAALRRSGVAGPLRPGADHAVGAGESPGDAGMNQERLMKVLVSPIVSEKSTMVAEKNEQVAFRVLQDATKPEIKAAVELLFKVQVESVQVLNQKGKAKRFGRHSGRRRNTRKAYVSLAPGQEINFVEAG